MSDEAYFIFVANAQKTENPHTIHEGLLHYQKVGVSSAVSGRRIIGPIFILRRVELGVLRKEYFGIVL
jgi:hypothetical protein